MFAINLACYLVIKVCPTHSQHIGVFILAGLGLFGSQLHRQIWEYGQNNLDLCVCTMYNYCRVTSLACCIKDGMLIKEARK